MANRKAVSSLPSKTGVDIHCHIFNARDLPVTQFITQVLLVEYPLLGDLLEPAIAFFAYIMDSGAPTADEEIKKLTEIELGKTTIQRFISEQKKNQKNRERKVIREALARLHEGDTGSTPSGRVIGLDISLSQKRAFLDLLYSCAFSRERAAGDAIHFDELAERLVAGPGGTDLTGLIPWCFKFTHYRFEILEDLVNFSSPSDREIGLYVPATVDYAYWLGEFNTTPISKQAEVMDAISRLKKPYAMHGYIAFDPARQALQDRPDILDNVIVDAIQNRQFVGIKLYPPMGFRPICNAELDDAVFPAALADQIGPKVGEKLDAALLVLYCWCRDNNVPIMAHCGSTNYARQGYEERADPQYWREVLEYEDRTGGHPFRDLRLNLGHSGGLKAFAENDVISGRWLRAVIDMLADTKYPNLYADIAFDEIALERDCDEKRANCKVKHYLKKALRGSPAAQKLMYGSDWIMLGYQDKNAEYYKDVKGAFSEIFDSDDLLDGFLGANARRFLSRDVHSEEK